MWTPHAYALRYAARRKRAFQLSDIIFATQIFAEDDEEVANFRRQSEEIADTVDIAELWEVVSDDQTALPFDDLSELYWGVDAAAVQQVALLLCLDKDTLYFEDGKAGYTPRAHDRR